MARFIELASPGKKVLIDVDSIVAISANANICTIWLQGGQEIRVDHTYDEIKQVIKSALDKSTGDKLLISLVSEQPLPQPPPAFGVI